MTRILWFPSNGSEGMYLQESLCDHCEHDINQDCPIILRSITDGEPIAEWTADDCLGRGLRCSNFCARKSDT